MRACSSWPTPTTTTSCCPRAGRRPRGARAIALPDDKSLRLEFFAVNEPPNGPR
ncbi:hypothetical protein ACFQ0B_56320 [Nonomuraea thailandensis]